MDERRIASRIRAVAWTCTLLVACAPEADEALDTGAMGAEASIPSQPDAIDGSGSVV